MEETAHAAASAAPLSALPPRRATWSTQGRPDRNAASKAASSPTPSPAADLYNDGGPPRWMSPLPSPSRPRPNPATLPLLFFLPGIDGVGLAAWPQFPGLATRFDVRFLGVPADDRTTFEGLVDIVVQALTAEASGASPPSRPVYVCGESFGGTLALAVAVRAPALVDRVLIINPATSFSRSPWVALAPLLARAPPGLYAALPWALAPVLGNPLAIAAGRLARSGVTGPAGAAAELAAAAAGLIPQLNALADALPAATLEWRLGLLKDGEAAVNASLTRVRARVLAVGGTADALLPSPDEVRRLAKALPRGRAVVLAGASHACLQEAGVDLVAIMDGAGFYTRHRNLSGRVEARKVGGARSSSAPPPPLLSADGSITPLTTPHPADPIALPTLGELDAAAGRATRFIRATTSPVFYSSVGGRMVRGLAGLPTQAQGRPLLFVGNHTTLALDMGVMVEELIRERGLLVRGLAHPVIFSSQGRGGGVTDGAGDGQESSPSSASASPVGGAAAAGRRPAGAGGAASPPASPLPARQPSSNGFEAFMTEYGAVPVSGRNFHRLLSTGQAVLLYPGGVREAYKKRGEAYQLFWVEGRDEFVRMAAKHGAVVVPFGCVGPEDSLSLIADADELARLPFVGPAIDARARSAAGRVRPARVGVSADPALDDGRFLAPLVLPGIPDRMYFAFREPIALDPALVRDRPAAGEVYKHVKAEVEGAITWLQEVRERDAYRRARVRIPYEAVSGRAAPSFEV